MHCGTLVFVAVESALRLTLSPACSLSLLNHAHLSIAGFYIHVIGPKKTISLSTERRSWCEARVPRRPRDHWDNPPLWIWAR